MRILMFGWEFPPFNSGGLGVACRGLTKALADANVSVVFVLPRPIETTDEHMEFRFPPHERIRARAINALLSPYLTSTTYRSWRDTLGGAHAPDLFSEVAWYAHMAEEIAFSEEFDVIHAHDWLAFPAGVAAKRVTGKPLILHVHLPSLDQGGVQGVDSRVFALERESFAAADAIIAISERVRTLLIEQYGVAPEKIRVVHNGLSREDDDRFVPLHLKEPGLPGGEGSGYLALYMGRLTVHKGPDYFLRAAEIVVRHEPSFRFVIAGSGELEGQLLFQAARAGLGKYVYFAGFVRGAERRALLRHADMLVMPSVAEPFGLIALEAAAEGTPAIISKQSGVRDVLSNSLAADFWDVEEIANHMLALARYETLRRFLAEASRQEALLSTWDKAAERCITLYTDCVGGYSRP